MSKSKAVIIAEDIVRQLPFDDKPRMFVVGNVKLCHAVRKNVEAMMRGMNHPKITMTVSDGNLYIGNRKPSRGTYTEMLESMVRRLMLSTENDRLYDEASALLESKR